jgi:hypothetical protein
LATLLARPIVVIVPVLMAKEKKISRISLVKSLTPSVSYSMIGAVCKDYSDSRFYANSDKFFPTSVPC